jgi:precorrin-4/cobalt-precorrin-4 C11-methyltransferase
MKVYFIGAGPGAPDLLTIRGKALVETARIVLYAGSLVNPEILNWAAPDAEIHDTSGMNLDQICKVFLSGASGAPADLHQPHIARLHTGDPALYGAIGEQILFCNQHGIPWEVVPGVSSFSASAAALGQELTLPGVSQTVIITRMAGRTPVPDRESLGNLARSRSTLALFLTAGHARHAMQEIEPAYGGDTPVAVVYRATWPEQRVLRGTISTIADMMQEDGIDRQAIILVGDVIGAVDFEPSKLYDAGFFHGYRQSPDGGETEP